MDLADGKGCSCCTGFVEGEVMAPTTDEDETEALSKQM
jgi:hypothetical protein